MMGSWSIVLAICGLVFLGIGVGGRLDDRTSGWLVLTALLFLALAATLHLSSLLLRSLRR